MRIAFIGAHSVGKSTLARALSKDLDLPQIDSIASNVWESVSTLDVLDDTLVTKDIRTSTSTFVHFQNAVLAQHIFAEEYHNEKFNGFVSARTVYDHYAYLLAMDLHEDELFESNYSKVELRHRMKHFYDFVFYVPIEFEISAQRGVGAMEHQLLIDKVIHNLLISLDGAYTILSGTVDERLSAARDKISNGGDYEKTS